MTELDLIEQLTSVVEQLNERVSTLENYIMDAHRLLKSQAEFNESLVKKIIK